MNTLYIRPTYVGVKVSSLAVATTNGAILVDEHIVTHFPANERGADIREWASEFYPGCAVEWGDIIQVS